MRVRGVNDIDKLKEKRLEELKQPTVRVYTTPSCPYCNQVKKYLKENDVDFVEYNVAQNRDRAIEMVQKTKQRGVPVTIIKGQTIVGFNKEAIDSALKQDSEW